MNKTLMDELNEYTDQGIDPGSAGLPNSMGLFIF